MAEEDTFRGVHLDPNAHHWDEVSVKGVAEDNLILIRSIDGGRR